MSEETGTVDNNQSEQQTQPAATPAEAVTTGKTADGREAFIPRERFDKVHQELQEVLQWKREREQSEMSESERLKAQLSELEPYRGQVQSLTQLIEQVLQRELENVPEDKRSQIEGDTPAAKLKDLMRLKALGLFTVQNQPPLKVTTPVSMDAQTGAGMSGKGGNLGDVHSRLAAEAQRQGYEIDPQKLAERIQQSKRGGTK